MDIEFLLWLQNFREATADLYTPVARLASDFAYKWLLIVPFIVYWCFNRRKGLYCLFSYLVGDIINSVIKLSACVSRPWLIDTRVVPSGGEKAMKSIESYSFPSSHSSMAASLYGGLAVSCAKKSRLIVWLCGILIVATALSRNYLGRHTPQDVIFGIIFGLVGLYITAKIFKYLAVYPERENIFLCAGLVICAILMLYIKFKVYPSVYVDGKLLPANKGVTDDAFLTFGFLVTALISRFIEKKFIKFRPVFESGFNFTGLIILAVGCVVMYFMLVDNTVYKEIIKMMFKGGALRRFMRGVGIGLFGMIIMPCVIKIFNNFIFNNFNRK